MKLYLALNMNNSSDVKTFTEENHTELIKLNNEGYNIYQSINSFFDTKRTSENIKEFTWFWIDLDYSIWKKEERHEVLTRIKRVIWVLPSKVNETYKWYHLFFSITPELKRLTTESYKESYNMINVLLQWDPKMKDVTAILKIEWYSDKKFWREDFIINTIYSDTQVRITKKVLEWLWLQLNLVTEEEFIKKIDKKEKNISRKFRNEKDIEEIDSLEFINMINTLCDEQEEWFCKYIELEEWGSNSSYSIKDTGWLKVYREDWKKYEIRDFTDKFRFWNRSFFLNYYLDEWIDKSKKYLYLNKVLKNLDSWLSLGLWGDKFSYSKLWAIDIVNNTVKREDVGIKTISSNSDLDQIDRIIKDNNNSNIQVWQVMKVLTWLLKYSSVNKLRITDEVLVSERELMEYIWLSVSKLNKEVLRKILVDMSRMVYSEGSQLENHQWEDFIGIHLKHYFDITVYSWQSTWKVLYLIKSSQPLNWGVTYLSEGLLSLDKWLSDTRKTTLWVKILLWIRSFKTYNLTLTEFRDTLKLSFKDEAQVRAKVVEYLRRLKKERLIYWFDRVTKNSYKIW